MATPAPVRGPSLFSLPELTREDYTTLCKIIYQYSRIHLGSSKRELLRSRLTKRVRELGLSDLKSYTSLLINRPEHARKEVVFLLEAIATHHTFFERETGHFDYLRDVVMPDWAKGRPRTLRIWSSACSTGEEPYNIAMHMHEFFAGQNQWQTLLLASDLSNKALRIAQEGIYNTTQVSRLPERWRKRYFVADRSHTGRYSIAQDLRDMIHFRQLNLFEYPYNFSAPFDLIFCRNAMIYFDPPAQQELVKQFEANLRPGGYLFIGHAESLSRLRHNLKSEQPAIYRKPA